jgi:hypothetical protein
VYFGFVVGGLLGEEKKERRRKRDKSCEDLKKVEQDLTMMGCVKRVYWVRTGWM